MIDCQNVEMRDRLPDLASDSLEPAVRELVLVHLTECSACTSEIEILRTTRLIMLATTPKVNVQSIVLALPQYGVKPLAAARPRITRSKGRPSRSIPVTRTWAKRSTRPRRLGTERHPS